MHPVLGDFDLYGKKGFFLKKSCVLDSFREKVEIRWYNFFQSVGFLRGVKLFNVPAMKKKKMVEC